MVRIIPMAASSSLHLASFRPLSLSSLSSCRSSSAATAARLAVSLRPQFQPFPKACSLPSRQRYSTGTVIWNENTQAVKSRRKQYRSWDSWKYSASKHSYWPRKCLRVGDKGLKETTSCCLSCWGRGQDYERFYTECLGMKLLRKRDIPEERYTNAFLGYGPEDSHFVVELTYNYGVDKYDIGTGFGHFGIAVEDVSKTVDLIKAKGEKVTREPGPVKGGKTVIAFIEDPDGYKFELLEREPTPEPLCQVMLRVGDLDCSINFYEKAFGIELLRKRDNPEYKVTKNLPPPKYTVAMMGYGPEDKSAVLELTYNYGVTEYDKGNGYAQITIGTDDVYKTAEAIKLCGGTITREPGPLPGINTKITACLDPDGWKSVFVDNIDFSKELE